MGKKDKKSRDPEKKAALAAKKEAKADKAALKRLQKEQDRVNSLSIHESDHHDNDSSNNCRNDCSNKHPSQQQKQEESLDSILASFRQRTKELETAVLEQIDTPFPSPPRGNFTFTLCPSNGLFYMVSVSDNLIPFVGFIDEGN